MPVSRPPRRLGRQDGIALLESLVSILILAIAVLGMLSVQLRTLAETQTSVRRAQSVRLIEDFAERIKTNPGGFRQLRHYVAGWDETPAAPDCRHTACDPETLARWDVARWKQAVAQTLPLGRAAIFESPSGEASPGLQRQLSVMVAWRANEDAAWDKARAVPLLPDTLGLAMDCPADLICHLAHVQP